MAVSVAKARPNFEARVRTALQKVVVCASELWRDIHSVGLLAKLPIRILAPLNGGPPKEVADLLNALVPDIMSMVLAYVINQKMNDGEPVGNICRLRRTCTAFATHPLFQPFVPRLVLAHSPPKHADRGFPHRTTVSAAPDLVYVRRTLALCLRFSLPGDPASETLFGRKHIFYSKRIALKLSLMTTYPDGSVHDVTDRFFQRRELLRCDEGFCLNWANLQACTFFRFGLLSSTINAEIRPRYAVATTKDETVIDSSAACVHMPPEEGATCMRAICIERGESVATMKRINKRRLADNAPLPPARRAVAPSPQTTSSSTFHFVVTSERQMTAEGWLPSLRWTSERFVSIS